MTGIINTYPIVPDNYAEDIRAEKVNALFEACERGDIAAIQMAPASMDVSDARTHVVVIGAGLAGLGAADELSQSCRVTILEAQGRIGGRVYSVVTSQGIPVEYGANWIHDNTKKNPLNEHVGTLIDARNYSVLDVVIYDTGERVDPEQTKELCTIAREIEMKSWAKDDSDSSHAEVCRQVAQKLQDKRGISDPTIEQALLLLFEEVSQDFSASAERIAYSGYDTKLVNPRTKEKIREWDCKGDDRFVVGGFTTFLEQLSKDKQIKLLSPVSEVTYGTSGCTVTYSHDGVTEHTPCDYVISTVPLGVLQSDTIQFDPPLPETTRSAIDGLAMGTAIKVILTFKDSYWAQEGDTATWITCISKKRTVRVFLNLDTYYPGSHTLMGMFLGDKAEKYSQLGNEALQNKILKVLSQIYPLCTRDTLIECKVKDWSKDPYTKGAYSYIPKASSAACFHALQQPVEDRLFFAGEHTDHTHVATMQAALKSGKRAADCIHQLLS